MPTMLTAALHRTHRPNAATRVIKAAEAGEAEVEAGAEEEVEVGAEEEKEGEEEGDGVVEVVVEEPTAIVVLTPMPQQAACDTSDPLRSVLR